MRVNKGRFESRWFVVFARKPTKLAGNSPSISKRPSSQIWVWLPKRPFTYFYRMIRKPKTPKPVARGGTTSSLLVDFAKVRDKRRPATIAQNFRALVSDCGSPGLAAGCPQSAPSEFPQIQLCAMRFHAPSKATASK